MAVAIQLLPACDDVPTTIMAFAFTLERRRRRFGSSGSLMSFREVDISVRREPLAQRRGPKPSTIEGSLRAA